MDVKHMGSPAAPIAGVAGDKAANSAKEDKGSTTAAAFAQLLSGLQVESVQDVGACHALTPEQAAAAAAMPVPELVDAQDVLAVDVQSLVGQTQQLDQAGDQAMRDGTFALQQQEAGLQRSSGWRGLASSALQAGQTVATVAAGVAPLAQATGAAALGAVATGVTLAQQSGVVDALQNALADVAGVQRSDDAGERVNLQGQWQLVDDTQDLPPALQKLVGQIEQWAAANAGVTPKPADVGTGARTAAEATAAVQQGGADSGTRLTEDAVRETQQSAEAAFEAPAQVPVEDMRFWTQGRQQRAQLTLQHEGQPVRVQVSVQGNEAHVTFLSDQSTTRDLLDAGLAQLRDMLEQQGVALAGVSVQAQTQDQESAAGQQPSGKTPGVADQRAEAQGEAVAAPVVGRSPWGAQGLDLYA